MCIGLRLLGSIRWKHLSPNLEEDAILPPIFVAPIGSASEEVGLEEAFLTAELLGLALLLEA